MMECSARCQRHYHSLDSIWLCHDIECLACPVPQENALEPRSFVESAAPNSESLKLRRTMQLIMSECWPASTLATEVTRLSVTTTTALVCSCAHHHQQCFLQMLNQCKRPRPTIMIAQWTCCWASSHHRAEVQTTDAGTATHHARPAHPTHLQHSASVDTGHIRTSSCSTCFTCLHEPFSTNNNFKSSCSVRNM
jgi:hypothetical protein